ncbi:hypothetical protein HY947_05970 [Candidatus Gottesmanbacteria bacterium]|nr:hypothetical protein [Candidatus Gottesmanbacteria bacterium]
MNKSVLQVPLDLSLRQTAETAALAQGFSSLQEAVRIFLHQMARKEILLSFQKPEAKLSQNAIKRYDAMIDDIDSGRTKLFKASTVDDLMGHLKGSKKRHEDPHASNV